MYQLHIEPKVSETDALGHINNTVMPVWFEAARTPLFRIFNPELDFDNWHMVVVGLALDYRRQTYYGRPAEVRGWVASIGKSSIKLAEHLYQDGELCVVNEAVYVNFDHETQRSRPISDAQREALQQHLKEDS
ncbi:MAG: acyl-CoA thioesterase [Microbacteriaceae bacterium]|nr:acyl-CoA thioesterase [Microbacteriaceae bacterium]